jgi:hypothetical protein
MGGLCCDTWGEIVCLDGRSAGSPQQMTGPQKEVHHAENSTLLLLNLLSAGKKHQRSSFSP